MTTKVVKGSLWTLAGQVAPLAVSLVATPFVIRLLGAESYGVLILIGLIPTYLGFADFGMSMASTKFGSEAYAEGDEEKEARIVRTAALIALMTSVPVAAALIIFASPVIRLFNVPEALQAEAATALRIAAVTFVVNFLCGIFNTPQLARLRMDLNTFINAGSRILGLIATPIVLYLGYGIIGAVTVLLAASLLNLLGHLVASRKLLRVLFGSSIDRTSGLRMAKYGFAIILATFASLFLTNAERGVLVYFESAEALAYYAVAFTLANMVVLFSASMIQSLIPAFSQLQSDEKRSQLNAIFARGIRLSLVWVVPVIVSLIVFAKPFFTVWAGPDFGIESSPPFYILAFGLFINIFAYLPHAIILAFGRSDLLAKIFWLELFPYAVLVWIMVSWFGILGAAAAWSIRISVDACVQFFVASKISGVKLPLDRLKGFSVGAFVMLVPVLAMLLLDWPILLVGGVTVASLCIYAIIVWRSTLENDERIWLSGFIRSRFAR